MLFVDLINASFFCKISQVALSLFSTYNSWISGYENLSDDTTRFITRALIWLSCAHPAQIQHLNLVCDCFSFEIFSIKLWTRKRFADHHLLWFADHHLLKHQFHFHINKKDSEYQALCTNSKYSIVAFNGSGRAPHHPPYRNDSEKASSNERARPSGNDTHCSTLPSLAAYPCNVENPVAGTLSLRVPVCCRGLCILGKQIKKAKESTSRTLSLGYLYSQLLLPGVMPLHAGSADVA